MFSWVQYSVLTFHDSINSRSKHTNVRLTLNTRKQRAETHGLFYLSHDLTASLLSWVLFSLQPSGIPFSAAILTEWNFSECTCRIISQSLSESDGCLVRCRVTNRPLKNGIVSYLKTRPILNWKGTHVVKVWESKWDWKVSMKLMNNNALYMKTCGNTTTSFGLPVKFKTLNRGLSNSVTKWLQDT